MMIEQIPRKARRLDMHYGLMWGTEGWNGIDRPIGCQTQYNSYLTKIQFLLVLALSESPLIKEIVEQSESGDDTDGDNIDFQSLANAKVLDGKKILDLGCGYSPTFARLTRWLGADTYTVDVIPSDEFELNPLTMTNEGDTPFQWTEKMKRAEKGKHICLDLRDKRALETILRASKGNFDMVTEAHLYSGAEYKRVEIYGPRDLDIIVMPLLREGGIFHHALESFNFKVKRVGKLISVYESD